MVRIHFSYPVHLGSNYIMFNSNNGGIMYIISIFIGLLAGTLSGLIGIGGGIIMIPALIMILNFNQHLSQGTTLAAMIPPIGILAAYEYYKNDFVNIPVALIIALGFVIGGFIGAKIAITIDAKLLGRIFGIVLLIISIKMIIGK
ncbi:MAG: sulfite exporter TauE/SafE family protein [Spirochaetota bacterium]|nr:sulfite exporter TauE/SafE family protein [Spirochaetota bacterium]